MANLKLPSLKNSAATSYLTLSFLIMLGSSFSFATYIPFLINRGMNLWQINLINSFFMATIILMEMPTGSFADKFGRHRSIALSCFILTFGMVAYFLSNNFWFFVVAEIIIGLSKTFVSGALEAWLVDSLKAKGEMETKEKIFRQESYFSSAGVIMGSIFGAYAGGFNLAWPWLMGGVLALIAALYSLKLKESYHEEGTIRTTATLTEHIKIAWKHGFNNRNLISFMLMGAVLATAVQSLNMQWTVVFQNTFHLETKYLGWIFAAIALTSALGGRLSKHGHKYIKDGRKTLALTQIITALMIIIVTQISGLAATLGFFLLHEVGRGAFGPLKKSFFNDNLVSETRATVISLDSMINKIGSLIGLLVSGFLASTYSIKVAWLASGIFLLAAAIFFLMPKKNVASDVKSDI